MAHSEGKLHPVLINITKNKRKITYNTDLLLASDLSEVVIAQEAVRDTRLAFKWK